MNPARALKKIALELREAQEDEDYVKLMRIDTIDEINAWAKERGWDSADAMATELSVPGEDFSGYYVDLADEEVSSDEITESSLGTVGPILVIVHGRLFPEKTKGSLSSDEKYAYLTSSDFDMLF